MDTKHGSSEIISGDLHTVVGNNAGGMTSLRQRVNDYGSDAKMTRESFEKYFSRKESSVA